MFLGAPAPKKALLFYELKKYFQLFQSYEVQYDKKFFKKIISKHLFFWVSSAPEIKDLIAGRTVRLRYAHAYSAGFRVR